MRHFFISDLVKELLGPRKGAVEEFPLAEEPRNEYTTGQLIPRDSVLARDPDEEEILGESVSSGDEDAEEPATSFINQAFIDAGQNFRRVPSSMGISFVLTHEPQDGDMSVCVTWGRYQSVEEKMWIRKPNCWIVNFSNKALTNGERSPDGTIQIDFKVTLLPKTSTYKVSVYITSLINPHGDGQRRPGTEEIIFQPEIRVVLKNREWLSELGDLSFSTDDDKEWRVSTRQYDSLKVYARGHLCGAYWDEVDPQRPFSAVLDPDLPFKWVDGLYSVEKNPEVKKFFQSHLRTDFIPLYAAPATIDDGQKFNLNVDSIAECADFDDLYEILNPFITAYEVWISELVPAADTTDIDREIISRNQDAADRIRRGIKFLKEDQDALLSFLFMNKVMAKQYTWGKAKSMKSMSWRPFQIAFILLSIESTVNRTLEREICDTIWFPTGGGKTEAYLGLAAFALAYRRRVSTKDLDGSKNGDGTCVISRYTLRLLTIQQFRRASKMIMACEVLRCSQVSDASMGWMPRGWKSENGLIWGHSPFSIGLWVGSRVTPNMMKGEGYRQIAPGAIPILSKPAQSDESDPAQILECPSCCAILSFPIDGVPEGELTLKLHVSNKPNNDEATKENASSANVKVMSISYEPNLSGNAGYLILDLNFVGSVSANSLHRWWTEIAERALGVRLNSFNVARPGYVPIESGHRGAVNDYEIRCPNPSCEINSVIFKHKLPNKSGEWTFVKGHPYFVLPNDVNATTGAPISATTVDKKLYERPPSMLIGTVDKFAQMAFTNEAASLFGRVRSFDVGSKSGFTQELPSSKNRCPISKFEVPLLIIQDELHLLDGPLGSTFGLYETVINELCAGPKYIASSATIRNSLEQIACLMGKRNNVFPPASLNVSRGFFLRSSENETHPLDESLPGRLFLGLAFPGRAPQTPMLRVWGRLLQTAQDLLDYSKTIVDSDSSRKEYLDKLDHFWTLIGYFNAVRELAQGETLVRQDIPQYLDKVKNQNPESTKREDLLANFKNLSSQTGSSELPGILAKMEHTLDQGDVLSAVAATSMFGTGVDVARLSLMIVHGQPKSSSQYIQAVGRIGRRQAGLAVVFFRVSKPRDLNHYEYFTGYHRKLSVAVEPITVKPLAPKALDRSIGALLAMLFRNWRRDDPSVPADIDLEDGAGNILRIKPETLKAILDIFEKKWEGQPKERRTDKDSFLQFTKSQIERWQEYARRQESNGQVLQYSKGNVMVLGQSEADSCVFSRVPQSLREVEQTIKLYIEENR